MILSVLLVNDFITIWTCVGDVELKRGLCCSNSSRNRFCAQNCWASKPASTRSSSWNCEIPANCIHIHFQCKLAVALSLSISIAVTTSSSQLLVRSERLWCIIEFYHSTNSHVLRVQLSQLKKTTETLANSRGISSSIYNIIDEVLNERENVNRLSSNIVHILLTF